MVKLPLPAIWPLRRPVSSAWMSPSVSEIPSAVVTCSVPWRTVSASKPMATSCSTSSGATAPVSVFARLASKPGVPVRRPDAFRWNTGASRTKREIGVPAAALPSA